MKIKIEAQKLPVQTFRVESKNNLKNILKKTAIDKEIRVLILNFSDKADFTSEKSSDNKIYETLKTFPVPIILIIKENASGFLFNFVLASHICFATESAEFQITSKKILKNQIGSKNISKLNKIKNKINAETALELGIINRIVSSQNIKKEALKLAAKISTLAPLALRSCIQAVNRGLEMNLADGLELETKLFTQIFSTRDMKEGTGAFLEKREPKFLGK
jgi:enoyl-CoA hydratase